MATALFPRVKTLGCVIYQPLAPVCAEINIWQSCTSLLLHLRLSFMASIKDLSYLKPLADLSTFTAISAEVTVFINVSRILQCGHAENYVW
jgi:hypothetical protein